MQEELAKQVAENGGKEDLKYMCAYKLVTTEFKWRGFQGKVENMIHKVKRSRSASDFLICTAFWWPACEFLQMY